MNELLVQRFGAFLLLRRLGAGRVTETFRARLALPGQPRPLALQRLLPAVAGERAFVEAWLHAAHATSRLSHVNLARVYEAGEVEGVPFLAMELVDGRRLDAVVERGRARSLALAPLHVARIGAGVASALQHVHGRLSGRGANEVAHLGVSPMSVQVTFTGDAKLTDLGVVRALEALGPDAAPPLGRTWAYAAPEHVRGDAADGRSDLFSLGVVLWELLAGRPLFPQGDPWEARRGVLEAEVPALRTVAPGVPPELDRLVGRLLNREPDRRPSSAAIVAAELDRFCSSRPLGRDERPLNDHMRALFGEERRRQMEEQAEEHEAWQRAVEAEGPPAPEPVALTPGPRRAERAAPEPSAAPSEAAQAPDLVAAPPEAAHPDPDVLAAPSEAAHPGPDVLAAPSEAAHPGPDVLAAPSEAAQAGPDVLAAPSEAAHPGPDVLAAPSEAAQAGPDVLAAPSEAAHPGPDVLAAPSEAAQAGPDVLAATSEAAQAGPDVLAATSEPAPAPPPEPVPIAVDASALLEEPAPPTPPPPPGPPTEVAPPPRPTKRPPVPTHHPEVGPEAVAAMVSGEVEMPPAPPARPPAEPPPPDDGPDDFSDLATLPEPPQPTADAPADLDDEEAAATTSNVGAWLVMILLGGAAATLFWYYLQVR